LAFASTTFSVSVEREPLRAAFPEHERLAVLDANLRLGRLVALGERVEDAVVVDDAVLEDFDECSAVEAVRGFEHLT
jgi:hypothetical protein